METARLHQNLTNDERLAVIRRTPIANVMSAPGHVVLRNPDAIEKLINDFERHHLEDMIREPILIGIFTDGHGSEVSIRSIECLDGHHRLLAGLICSAWLRIEDLPPGAVDTRVNGWPAGGTGPEDRWIPLEVVQRSTLDDDEWCEVPAEWGAKGPTARIAGTISSGDAVFDSADCGVTLGSLAKAWENR